MPEVPYRKTTLTRSGARAAVETCFAQLFGRPVEPQELAMLLSQSEHETGGWQHMPNYNWGGIKAFMQWRSNQANGYRIHMTTEGAGADAKRVPQHFRAYATAEGGCADWLDLLSRLWPGALAAAQRGLVAQYVDGLRHGVKGAYFTGDVGEYTRSMERLFARWCSEIGVPTRGAA